MVLLTGETPQAIIAGMGESTDTFTQSNAQGREGMESERRDTSVGHENGPEAHKISLVSGMSASAHIHTS